MEEGEDECADDDIYECLPKENADSEAFFEPAVLKYRVRDVRRFAVNCLQRVCRIHGAHTPADASSHPLTHPTTTATPSPQPHHRLALQPTRPCSSSSSSSSSSTAAAAAQQQQGTAGKFVPRKGAAGSPFVGGLSLKWNWIAVLKAHQNGVFRFGINNRWALMMKRR